MTRADIEKEFVHDGGLEFPDRATYTYRRCRYVKVDVEFQPRANDTISFSPDDQAAKISRPYLAYPVSD